MKNNRVMMFIIVILILMIFGLTGYIVYDRLNKTEAGETITVQNDKEYVYEEKFNYEMNNKKYKLAYKYYYEDYTYGKDIAKEELDILKENNEYIYSTLYMDIYINDVKIYDPNNFVSYNTTTNKDKVDGKSLIKERSIYSLDDSNSSKKYMILELKKSSNVAFDGASYLLFINDKLDFINRIDFKENTSLNVKNNDIQKKYGEKEFYINKNKLFYLKSMPDCESNVESVITINNNMVSDFINNKYEANNAGAC